MFDRVASEAGQPATEYEALRRRAALIDRSELGLLEVTGRDRAAFLHAMLSNDVKRLTPGTGCAAAFLDVHGKVQELLLVWALEDRIHVLTGPGRAAKTLEALDKFLFSEKAYFRDATGERAWLVLAGPAATDVAARLGVATIPDAPWSHTPARIGGADVRVVRGAGETGESELWLETATADAGQVRAALIEHGVVPVGFAAWESARIEAGTPVLGRDVDDTVLLPEIPLEPLVSYTKGCYVGQEVVVRIRDRGHVNRHLRGLRIEGDEVPAPGTPVVTGGQDVGRVTSAVRSLGLRGPIALGFVRRQHAEPGTRLTVGSAPATVVAPPFER